MFEGINYLAVLVAVLAHFMVGMVWYGVLFGKKWAELVAPDPKDQDAMKAGAMKAMVGHFISLILLAYATARLIGLVKPENLSEALILGMLLYVGYILVTELTAYFYEMRPIMLLLINTGYHLIGLLIVTTILFYWK